MIRRATVFLRYSLTIALALGMILSSNARIDSHDVIDLAKILTEHNAQIEDHGHAHEDIVDVMHAYYGHAHDVADHDHNIAFLPPREALVILVPKRKNSVPAKNVMLDRRSFDLERPPRV